MATHLPLLPEIEHSITRQATTDRRGQITLGFRNLTSDEAARMLLVLAEIQRDRAERDAHHHV